MSHKMLNQEMKERESILQMINSTVSHELRNPVYAIIEQNVKMRSVLALLLQIMNQLLKDSAYDYITNSLK